MTAMRNHYLRALFFLTFFCLFSAGGSAQRKMVYYYVDRIGEGDALYYYSYINTPEQGEQPCVMVLQADEEGGLQRFGSVKSYLEDSLAYAFGNEPQETRLLMSKSGELRRNREAFDPGRTDWVILKNYPKEGSRVVLDKVLTDKFRSDETDEAPRWTLGSETKEIGGYLCKQASAEFYGRKWSVWYAPEVSVPYGPWLLGDLPGLVMEAVDESGDHTFSLLRIERRDTPILYRKTDYLEAERSRVLEQQKQYYRNRGRYAKGALSEGSYTTPVSDSPELPFSPLRVY